LFDAYDYIAADNTEAAVRLLARVKSTVSLLSAQPMLGRPSRFRGRRELVIEQYVVTYRLYSERVAIVAFEHGAQRR
jgi:plasmid stabilization system protein ParE